jgi:hypothetical protein
MSFHRAVAGHRVMDHKQDEDSKEGLGITGSNTIIKNTRK